MEDTLRAILKQLREVLDPEVCERWARETGLVKRRRKIGGWSFLLTWVAWMASEEEVSYGKLSQQGAWWAVEASPQAWAKKCGEAGVRFLRRVLAVVVEQAVTTVCEACREGLQGFTAVLIRDSTWVEVEKGEYLKLQVRWDVAHGRLEGPAVQEGSTHDRRSPYTVEQEPLGALVMEDRA